MYLTGKRNFLFVKNTVITSLLDILTGYMGVKMAQNA